ncbi:DegT/DnrJ/EryC1/StrS family aminotransferase [Lentzea sp.]|uniref:DegT/DnrJ/EryC1/StrS family aminotransferase n=1 Tax=Lentzea sp. TaxID=56099 RepID=UPI002BD1BC4A|nr:DegT/DnrJ/EryC1/StrS family aminotransferase [Lentzea sp.]HUQ56459.1 DegT/DnrJ/EryC1/StrS family aminotransferase [Lentzea sp.]
MAQERPADREDVPFFDGSASFEREWPDLERHLNEVFDASKYSHGIKTEQLEEEIRRFTGARYAVAMNSGTDALILLLRAAGIGPGDEVVVPCYSFFATASSVCHAGARPVFVDVEPETYAIDPAAIKAAVTGRTRAVMPVHLFNQMADMPAINAVAAEAGIAVVEDSAEAIAMFQGGVHAGLHGLGGVLSFFPTKTLGAIGDAGMVITDDALVADRCAVLRHHGRMGTTVGRISGISNAASISGTNSKTDEVQAAALLTRLPRLARAVARRAELARLYDEGLAGISEVRRPSLVDRGVAANPVWYVYLVEAQRRDELAAFLAAEGIGTEAYYPRPLHLQPCFADLGHRPGDFPVAEAAADRALALPLYPDLTADQVDRVCRAVERFYAGGAR